MTTFSRIALLGLLLPGGTSAAEEPRVSPPLALLRPVIEARCLDCHGPEGEAVDAANLDALHTVGDLAARPELAFDLVRALDSGAMPPEGEDPLPAEERTQLVARLRELLRTAVAARVTPPRTPIRRMNRFQYANAVQDLLELNVSVFSLPERMLREHDEYFQPHTGRMPDRVVVGSRPLGKSQLIEPRLAGVAAFPQDLRAEHGFDNRGDHLSLSPLLLESFLRLGRSIVDSPDFDAKTCGLWPRFFAPPGDDAGETATVVRERLDEFLTHAFRRPVEADLLDRYTAHVVGRLDAGEAFPDAMKSAAAAALASPRFLYLYDRGDAERPGDSGDDYDLASRLSFLLWGSLPDRVLLDRAATGTLHEPEVLRAEVERMLRDRRLKRFCDSFPSQWLQLERIVSSTPEPERFPQFYFQKYRASMHMMLEPLLLFETVLIENRPVRELIDPDFAYRSPLLKAWYRNGTRGGQGGVATVPFDRVPVGDGRFGGVITNAAVMTMTSGATRTKPITRGAWIASVILNDAPEPPPADVPPLEDEPPADEADLTLRERFAAHRTRADCAGCHARIDPLGFALENFDAAGVWRTEYGNGRSVDPAGTLFGRYAFTDVAEFKSAILRDEDRFPRAFASHLLSFALGREVGPADTAAIEEIVKVSAANEYRFHALIHAVVASEPFLRPPADPGSPTTEEHRP